MTDSVVLRREYANGKPTGFYYCSVCNDLFKPNPENPNEMRTTFEFHVRAAHAAKKPREDVNQAAARIVREATEKD
jgi:hypothetical protein